MATNITTSTGQVQTKPAQQKPTVGIAQQLPPWLMNVLPKPAQQKPVWNQGGGGFTNLLQDPSIASLLQKWTGSATASPGTVQHKPAQQGQQAPIANASSQGKGGPWGSILGSIGSQGPNPGPWQPGMATNSYGGDPSGWTSSLVSSLGGQGKGGGGGVAAGAVAGVTPVYAPGIGLNPDGTRSPDTIVGYRDANGNWVNPDGSPAQPSWGNAGNGMGGKGIDVPPPGQGDVIYDGGPGGIYGPNHPIWQGGPPPGYSGGMGKATGGGPAWSPGYGNVGGPSRNSNPGAFWGPGMYPGNPGMGMMK